MPAACPHCHQLTHTLDGSCPSCAGWADHPPPDWGRFDTVLDVVVWICGVGVVLYFGAHLVAAFARAVAP